MPWKKTADEGQTEGGITAVGVTTTSMDAALGAVLALVLELGVIFIKPFASQTCDSKSEQTNLIGPQM